MARMNLKITMAMAKKRRPLADRFYVKTHGMSELDEMIDNMLWSIIYVLLAHSILFSISCSLSENSWFHICKIWEYPYVRNYLAVLASVIVVMLLFALCHLMAKVVRMCKEKDDPDCHQWEEDVAPQPFDL